MARFATSMKEQDFREWIRTKFFSTVLSPNDEDAIEIRQELETFRDDDIERYLLHNFEEYTDNYELWDYFPKAKKDLSKVYFSFENLRLALGIRESYGVDDELYFHARNNVCLMLCEAGGDWEQPIWFVLYVDNRNNLRAYIPTKGNTYCKKYKCAYGSIIDIETDLTAEEAEQMDEEGQGLQVDFSLLLDDAFSRIQAT